MSHIMFIGNPNDEIPTTPLGLTGLESVGELDMKLALQGAELEAGLAERISGIGSPRHKAVGREVLRYRYATHVLRDTKLAPHVKKARLLDLAKRIDQEHRLAGIGFLKFLKKAAGKVKSTVSRAARAVRQSNLIKKVAHGITTGAKAAGRFAVKTAKAGGKLALKAATLPIRLFIKGLAEVTLPRASTFFLYLFITNPATIASLPAAVQAKRRKAEKFARFLTKTVGMKEEHFMKIVRNGIVKQTKQTPEQLLATHVQGSLSGVGVLPLALLPVLTQIVQKIAALFGKKPAADETPTESDAPDVANDFDNATATVKRQVLTHLRYKPASQQGYPAAPPAEEEREQRQEDSAMQQVYEEAANTPVEAELPSPEPEESTQPELLAPDYSDYDSTGGDEAAPESEEPQF